MDTPDTLASRLPDGQVVIDAEVLAGRGLTVAHYPQSVAISTVGGWPTTGTRGALPCGWDGAVRSCAAVGGTLTHHHGVGRPKSAFLASELEPTGVDVLARIKAALDPDQIMNLGVLLP